MQRFSGAQAFQFYAVPIFRQTFGGMSPHGGAVAVAFVQLLASLLSGLLIDTVGRLPLLIASSVFMSMALAGFGSFAYYMEAQVTITTPLPSDPTDRAQHTNKIIRTTNKVVSNTKDFVRNTIEFVSTMWRLGFIRSI